MVFGTGSGVRRTEFNLGEGGAHTSVKVHHAPGGASSFSLAGDHRGYEPPKPKNQTPIWAPVDEPQAKVPNQHYSTNFSIGGGYGDYSEPPRSSHGKARVNESKHDSVWTGSSQIAGDKGQFDGPSQAHTSIKVNNPPGGKSSITF
jgi:hypothetical protein